MTRKIAAGFALVALTLSTTLSIVSCEDDETCTFTGNPELCTCDNNQTGKRLCDKTGKWSICTSCGTTCAPNTKEACTCSDNTSTGQKTCSAQMTWGACTEGCPAPKVCTAGQQQDCTTCGTGKQTCNATGTAWEACVCSCTPNATGSCTCADQKQGTRTCNADGKTWSDCTCGTGQICTPSSTATCYCPGGKESVVTCNVEGNGWGVCQGCDTETTACGSQSCTRMTQICVVAKDESFCQPLPAQCPTDRSCFCAAELCEYVANSSADKCVDDFEKDNLIKCEETTTTP